MKKFVFTLKSLLHVKQLLEKQERHLMLSLTQQLNALEGERDRLRHSRAAAADALSGQMHEGIPAAQASQQAHYLSVMTDLLAEQEEKILAKGRELETCRQRLVEILREINMLEKVREKQYQQYLAEVQLEEDKAIGDFVSYQTTANTKETT